MMHNMKKNKQEKFNKIVKEKHCKKICYNDIIKKIKERNVKKLNYKLLAIDLDGTLLNSQGEISDENKKAIEEIQKHGVEVVLASGRVPDSIERFSKEINSNKYLIAGNGTIIKDIQKDEIIYDNFISKEKTLKIVKLCEENSVFCNVYTQKSIITKSLNYNVQYYYYENSKKNDDKRTNINIVEDLYKYIDEINTSPISKINICDENQVIFNSIINKLREISGVTILDVEHMSRKVIKSGTEYVDIQYYYTEITNENANKWEAIKRLISKININEEEVIAIGDNINDKEMIENAGLGIIMGDSALSINNKEKIITKSNNENGVAYAINNYILK